MTITKEKIESEKAVIANLLASDENQLGQLQQAITQVTGQVHIRRGAIAALDRLLEIIAETPAVQ